MAAGNVPTQYQGWVQQASRGTGLPPAVVAAQINTESGFNPRATSPTGAQGIAQFEPGTWKGLGVNGSPYNPGAALQGYIKFMGALVHQYGGNVRNALAAYNAGSGNLQAGYGYADHILQQSGGAKIAGASPSSLGASLPTSPGQTIASTRQVFNAPAYEAAKARAIAGQYISATSKDPFTLGQPKTGISTAADTNPLIASGVLTTSTPNPANYMRAQTTLQHLAGSVPLNQHPAAFSTALKGSGYTDPLPGAQWERTDMGVDASMKNGAPIKALGDSRVTNIHTFYQGQPIITMQLLNGPDAGRFWYVSEAINSNVKPGDVVRAGQTIGTYNSGGTGLELGWAGNAQGDTLAQTQGNTGGPGHSDSPAGKSFRNFLNQLGAGAG